MSAKPRLILDIRYYESDRENIAGSSLPGETGGVFNFPKSINPLGARIARKLREFGFITGEFDHLYVNFTTVLKEGECCYSPRQVEKWFRYIDFGMSPEKCNRLSDAEKEDLVCSATISILKFVASESKSQLALVDRVLKLVQERGSKLEITHIQKETAEYAIVVTYQIRPNGEGSVGLIEYHDKKSGAKRKSEFVTLEIYEDIFPLVGSISVSKGVIALKPRQSFKASLTSERYRTPIEIAISEMDPA